MTAMDVRLSSAENGQRFREQSPDIAIVDTNAGGGAPMQRGGLAWLESRHIEGWNGPTLIYSFETEAILADYSWLISIPCVFLRLPATGSDFRRTFEKLISGENHSQTYVSEVQTPSAEKVRQLRHAVIKSLDGLDYKLQNYVNQGETGASLFRLQKLLQSEPLEAAKLYLYDIPDNVRSLVHVALNAIPTEQQAYLSQTWQRVETLLPSSVAEPTADEYRLVQRIIKVIQEGNAEELVAILKQDSHEGCDAVTTFHQWFMELANALNRLADTLPPTLPP